MVKSAIANLWFDWIILTLIYLITFYGSGEMASPFYLLNPLVGLFVPIGFWNLTAMFQAASPATLPATSYAFLYVLPLLFLVLFFGNRFGKERVQKFWLRVLLNLISLLLLTAFVDLIIWHKWYSWELFSNTIFYISHGRIDLSVL